MVRRISSGEPRPNAVPGYDSESVAFRLTALDERLVAVRKYAELTPPELFQDPELLASQTTNAGLTGQSPEEDGHAAARASATFDGPLELQSSVNVPWSVETVARVQTCVEFGLICTALIDRVRPPGGTPEEKTKNVTTRPAPTTTNASPTTTRPRRTIDRGWGPSK